MRNTLAVIIHTPFRSGLLTLLLATTVLAAASSDAEIYKHADEYGNITYSDEPPTPKAKPIKLKPLNTAPAIEIRSQRAAAPTPTTPPTRNTTPNGAAATNGNAKPPSLSTTAVPPTATATDALAPSPAPSEQHAKRSLPASSTGHYKLRIASPKQDFRYGPSDKMLNVIILSKQKLNDAHQFQLYVDGQPKGAVTQLNNINVTLTPEMRGQVTLIVAVVDSLGTRIETSAPVTILVNHSANRSTSNQ